MKYVFMGKELKEAFSVQIPKKVVFKVGSSTLSVLISCYYGTVTVQLNSF